MTELPLNPTDASPEMTPATPSTDPSIASPAAARAHAETAALELGALEAMLPNAVAPGVPQHPP